MDIKDPDIRKQAKNDNQDNDKKNDRISKLDEQLLQLILENEV